MAIMFVVLAAFVSGCGSAATPTATPTPDVPEATNGSGDGASVAETTAPAAGNGGGGELTIADAAYASGAAHVEVSGGKQLSYDGQLVPGTSITTAGTTVITYQGTVGADVVAFAISASPDNPDAGLSFALTVGSATSPWVTGGDRTSGCAIELSKNDATGLEGHFTCAGMQALGTALSTIDVTASFSAER